MTQLLKAQAVGDVVTMTRVDLLSDLLGSGLVSGKTAFTIVSAVIRLYQFR
jgi:hypothetical protein